MVWDTGSPDVTGSMPLGNGRLGVNVWVTPDGTVGLLLSHVDALDENGVLSKLGDHGTDIFLSPFSFPPLVLCLDALP